jgi:hypothetical protein
MPNGWKYKSFDFNGLTKGFEDGGLTGFLSGSRSGKRALLRKANGAPAVRVLRLRASRSAQDDIDDDESWWKRQMRNPTLTSSGWAPRVWPETYANDQRER